MRINAIRMSLALVICVAGSAAADPVALVRQVELEHLVRHDCGSCHGMTLNGGLGPALTPQALSRKPVVYVTNVILDGRPGTAMPGWRPLLSEAEAAWIAKRLLEGLPDAR
ncbi:MAG: cytochrome c [Betaproteobacteria bacterium]|nr:cytochrome c [Betaproteobacteria bacterium]